MVAVAAVLLNIQKKIAVTYTIQTSLVNYLIVIVVGVNHTRTEPISCPIALLLHPKISGRVIGCLQAAHIENYSIIRNSVTGIH